MPKIVINERVNIGTDKRIRWIKDRFGRNSLIIVILSVTFMTSGKFLKEQTIRHEILAEWKKEKERSLQTDNCIYEY